MASNTTATSVKRKNKHEKAGRRRKNKLARKSTASTIELFAARRARRRRSSALSQPYVGAEPRLRRGSRRLGRDAIDRVHALDPRQRADHLLQLIEVLAPSAWNVLTARPSSVARQCAWLMLTP